MRITDRTRKRRYTRCANCSNNCQYCDDITEIEKEAHNRLTELEDKIENGTLIELPCKVGDTIYEAVKGLGVDEYKVTRMMTSFSSQLRVGVGVMDCERIRDNAHWKFWIEDINITWFATKWQAEKKLKEL